MKNEDSSRFIQMKEIMEKNFGVIIAFLLPGFLLLWGLSFTFNEVAVWISKSSDKNDPTIGGFLYTTLASLALGLLISAIRWLMIDHLHHITGVQYPNMNFQNLSDKDRFSAFHGIVENHYRYYQYYANTLVAILIAFIVYIFLGSTNIPCLIWLVFIIVIIALFLGSRDALKKYYDRGSAILSNTKIGESYDKRLRKEKESEEINK